jgi:hypothetical protein
MGEKIVINKDKLLLVEGIDEQKLFESIFRKKNISDIQIIPSGGVNNFKRIFKAITLTRGFDEVLSIGIVQDADNDFKARFDSICHTLTVSKLTAPTKTIEFTDSLPRIGIYIMPDCKSEGMLETLCIDSVKKTKEMKCVNLYFDCLKQYDIEIPNLPKSRAQVYLSSKNPLVKSVGIAANKGIWDFDSNGFKKLIDFIHQI